MVYEYTGKTASPNLGGIHTGVAASAMTDKTIEDCTWHEDNETLTVRFTGTLSAGDKTLLDGIVATNS